jgi:triosephosphate isomerase
LRIPIIFGNWKMNKTSTQAVELAAAIVRLVKADRIEVGIAPPFTALKAVKDVISGSRIHLAGQNVHWELEGAYTGEISPEFLVDSGCDYVIIGHSERRQYFRETNDAVGRKLKSSFSVGLKTILCIGETLNEREAGKTEGVIEQQVRECLQGVPKAETPSLVIAYEPVWAIGTGRTATPAQAQDVHHFIRSLLEELYDRETSTAIRIQYGGSVKPDNASSLLKEEDIDGFLVGGASLEAESFARIIKNSMEALS